MVSSRCLNLDDMGDIKGFEDVYKTIIFITTDVMPLSSFFTFIFTNAYYLENIYVARGKIGVTGEISSMDCLPHNTVDEIKK